MPSMNYKEEGFRPLLFNLLIIFLAYINTLAINLEPNIFYFIALFVFSIIFLLDNKISNWILLAILIPYLYLPLFPLLLWRFKNYWPLLTLYGLILINTNYLQLFLLLIISLVLIIDYLMTKNDEKIQAIQDEKDKYGRLLDQYHSLEEKTALEVSEKERSRMIQTLHDNVGHILTRSIFYVDILKSEYDETIVLKLETSLKDVHKEIRASIYNAKDNLSNLTLLKEMVDNKNQTIEIVFNSYLLFSKISKVVQNKILQTIKEFETNMKKHSNGKKLTILLFEKDGTLNFILFDNGTLNEPFQEKMGLSGIRERFESHHATITIKNLDGFKIMIEGIDSYNQKYNDYR